MIGDIKMKNSKQVEFVIWIVNYLKDNNITNDSNEGICEVITKRQRYEILSKACEINNGDIDITSFNLGAVAMTALIDVKTFDPIVKRYEEQEI